MFISYILFPFLLKKASTHFSSTLSVSIYFKTFYAGKNFSFQFSLDWLFKLMVEIIVLSFLQMYIRIRREPNLSTPYVFLDTTLYCLCHVMPRLYPAAAYMRGEDSPLRCCEHLQQQAGITEMLQAIHSPRKSMSLTSGRGKNIVVVVVQANAKYKKYMVLNTTCLNAGALQVEIRTQCSVCLSM